MEAARKNKFVKAPLDVRFWEKVDKTRDCWEWLGHRGSHGYGTTWDGAKNCLTHRLAYQLVVGPIPDGWHLHHLCLNRVCVNPAHLELLTQADHLRREHSGRFGRSQKRVLQLLTDGPKSARQLERGAPDLTETMVRHAGDRLRSRGFVELAGRDERACQMYGLTETGAVLASSRPDPEKEKR